MAGFLILSSLYCSPYSSRGSHHGMQEEVFNLKQLKPSVVYPNKATQSINLEPTEYFHKINSTDLTFLSDIWNGHTCNMYLGKDFSLMHLSEKYYMCSPTSKQSIYICTTCPPLYSDLRIEKDLKN